MLPLQYQPGTKWGYSLGFDVLGVVIEKITGTPLDQYLGDRVFAPLGMVDTSSGFRRTRPRGTRSLCRPIPTHGLSKPSPIHNVRGSWIAAAAARFRLRQIT